MVDVRDSENIYLWALATKGSTWMVNLNGDDLINQVVNRAGFCATAVLVEID